MSGIYYTNGGGDEQYTPEHGVQILLPHIQHLKDKIIWCPFDKKDSNFVKILTGGGFNVVYSHLEYGQDFFEYEPDEWDVLISNPPYKNKRLFIERAMSFNKPFALLLPITTLSDQIWNILIDDIMDDFGLLIPKKRMRFFNKLTGEVGKQPTFKAAYFGVNIFKNQLILEK